MHKAQAVNVRHHPVGDQRIGLIRSGDPEGLFATRTGGNFMARLFKQQRHQVQQALVAVKYAKFQKLPLQF